MKPSERIKLFAMSAQMLERDLDSLEESRRLDLRRSPKGTDSSDRDEEYYPQFRGALRIEASEMAQHYEIFYCLERSIRELIRDTLSAEKGATWWDTAVPEKVRENVRNNISREEDAGFTRRSEEPIDYTTFGELGEIVRTNWVSFADTFNSEKAFSKVMSSLNLLRGPIAHCCALAEDEVQRLQLALKDWYRLME